MKHDFVQEKSALGSGFEKLAFFKLILFFTNIEIKEKFSFNFYFLYYNIRCLSFWSA